MPYANPEAERSYKRRYRAEYPDKSAPKLGWHDYRESRIGIIRPQEADGAWRRAGINMTWSRFLTLLEKQKGVCAFCGGPPKPGYRLAVDHDHETGAIRGLLCGKCNRVAVGSHTVESAERLIVYLKARRETSDG